MKTIAIIQARAGSTRLPEKVLLELEGKTVLQRVVERVVASQLIDMVVVATTVNEEDAGIVELCSNIGVKIYRGSESDVLDRFYQAAKIFQADHIVRITADCPLIDPKVITAVLSLHLNGGADYTSNILKETFPDGEDVEVFTFDALEKAWLEAKLASEREHVTPYIRKRPELFTLANYAAKEDLSGKRWTLDNAEDYQFIKNVYRHLYKEGSVFGIEEVLSLLRSRPKLEALNKHIKRNEGYKKSLKEDAIMNRGNI